MANNGVKCAAKAAGIKLWEVAEAVGVADSTFSRQLRRELPEDKRERVLAAIHELAKHKAGAEHGE